MCSNLIIKILYVGGSFAKVINGGHYQSIISWNGTSWSPMGFIASSGSESRNAHAFTLFQGDLYASGKFWIATTVVNGVAKWNGSSWSAVSSGLGGYVYELLSYNNKLYAVGSSFASGSLYAGGRFTSISGVSASRLAKWNGTKWQAVGGGVDNDIYALQVAPSFTITKIS